MGRTGEVGRDRVCEVSRVCHSEVDALACERRHEMRCVAEQRKSGLGLERVLIRRDGEDLARHATR